MYDDKYYTIYSSVNRFFLKIVFTISNLDIDKHLCPYIQFFIFIFWVLGRGDKLSTVKYRYLGDHIYMKQAQEINYMKFLKLRPLFSS